MIDAPLAERRQAPAEECAGPLGFETRRTPVGRWLHGRRHSRYHHMIRIPVTGFGCAGRSVVENEAQHLRVLIANERRESLELLAQVVTGLGHDVIAREVDVKDVGAVTARESPDVALVGLGLSWSMPST